MVPTVFKVGLPTTEPAEAKVYQVIPVVETKASLAFKVWIGLSSHSVILPKLVGAAGVVSIVKVTAVLVKLEQVPLEYSA